MTFSHKQTPVKANYNIKDIPIERVEEIRDLGVIMDPKLSFTSHFEEKSRQLPCIRQKRMLLNTQR